MIVVESAATSALGGWMSVPFCAMCTARSGEQVLTSPRLWQQVLPWQEPLPPGLAVQTLEKAISSSSLAAPLPDTNTLQLL